MRALAIWCVIAAAETLHGILRVRWLNPRVGDRCARRLGVLSGSLIILAIVGATIGWLGVRTAGDCFLVGGLWLILMLGFDLGLGRAVFRLPWKRLLGELDPRQGGWLGFGMLILLLAPWLMARLRGLL